MIPFYDKTRGTHIRGTRADQPAVADVWVGSLYFVTDEGVIERSNGVTWESYSGSGNGGSAAAGMLMAGLDEGPGQEYIIQQKIEEGGWVTQVTTSTGTQNDFNLDGHKTLLFANNASLLTFTGFKVLGNSPANNDKVIIISIGAGNVYVSHQTGSSSANQLTNFVTSAGTPLAAGVGVAEYAYYGGGTKWRMQYHCQGAFITSAFDAANYVTNGGGTWTVDSGDVVSMAHYLDGRRIFLLVYLNTTTWGAVAGNRLNILQAAWGGFTVNTATNMTRIGYMYDNGNTTTQMFIESNGTNNGSIGVTRFDNANFTAAVNLFYIRGDLTVEVT